MKARAKLAAYLMAALAGEIPLAVSSTNSVNPNPYRKKSEYQPHQGAKEKARRLQQLTAGKLVFN